MYVIRQCRRLPLMRVIAPTTTIAEWRKGGHRLDFAPNPQIMADTTWTQIPYRWRQKSMLSRSGRQNWLNKSSFRQTAAQKYTCMHRHIGVSRNQCNLHLDMAVNSISPPFDKQSNNHLYAPLVMEGINALSIWTELTVNSISPPSDKQLISSTRHEETSSKSSGITWQAEPQFVFEVLCHGSTYTWTKYLHAFIFFGD